MRRVVYDVAVTLDGLICGPDEDISAFPHEGDHVTAYMARLAAYSTVIMGRRTYEFGYRYGLKPGARAYKHMDHHIFSTTLQLPADAEVDVVREGWVERVAALKNAHGGDIYLCGGGAFAGLLARAGMIDVLRLKIVPAVIGAGTRLFDRLDQPLKLKRVATQEHATGVTFAEYIVEGGTARGGAA